MRPSLREHRGKRKQVPPLRRRMRSGSGRNDKSWEAFLLWAEEVPGFAIGVVEAGAAVVAAAEEEAGNSEGGVQRDDVPGVFGDDVGGDEMDFAGEVRNGASVDAAVGVDAVETFEKLGGTFHLDAPERRGGVGWERGDFAGSTPRCSLGWLLCNSSFWGCRNTRFLHCAAACAPAPVGMTKQGHCIGWAAVGMAKREHCLGCGHRRGEIAGVEDDVVAFAVAVGTGDSEAEAGRFESES